LSSVRVSQPVKLVVPADVLTATIRDFVRVSDENFIFHSWGNSYRDAALAAWGDMPKATYYKRVRTRIEALLSRGAELKLAVDPDDPNLILGWACAEAPVLHYVYIKEAYRRQGLALQLMGAVGLANARVIPCSHWTPHAELVASKRPALFRRVDLF
jgi:hypothetical protein